VMFVQTQLARNSDASDSILANKIDAAKCNTKHWRIGLYMGLHGCRLYIYWVQEFFYSVFYATHACHAWKYIVQVRCLIAQKLHS